MQFIQLPTRAFVNGDSALTYSSHVHSINHFRYLLIYSFYLSSLSYHLSVIEHNIYIFIQNYFLCFRHISLSNSFMKISSRQRNSTKFGNLSKVTDSGKQSLIPQSPTSELPSQSNLDNTLLELDEYSSDVPLEQISWSWQAYAALDGLLCV